MVRRLIAFLLFLVLADDNDAFHAKTMGGPMAWVHGVLVSPLPIKVRPFDLAMLAILLVTSSRRDAKGPRVAPMQAAMLLALATTVAFFAYGIVTGGDGRAASWQTYLMLSGILVSFTVAANFRTPEHYSLLAKVLVAVALYHAAMCWYFYVFWVQAGRIVPFPEYITTHDDSVIWVVTILVLLLNTLTLRSPLKITRNLATVVFILGALQFNNRRLAWLSLFMGLIVAYALLAPGRVKRSAKRIVMIATPILALYIAIGWGRTERIFAPVRSISSVSTQEDASTKARNCENLGLIATVARSNYLTGTGWGHPYVELTTKYSIHEFELWPYIPHNSILGLLAYTGLLGFVGYWLMVPTAVFVNSRLARFGNTKEAKMTGLVAAAQMIVCANQMYGDMGIFSIKTQYVLAASFAVALRVPIVAGAWEFPSGRAAALGRR